MLWCQINYFTSRIKKKVWHSCETLNPQAFGRPESGSWHALIIIRIRIKVLNVYFELHNSIIKWLCQTTPCIKPIWLSMSRACSLNWLNLNIMKLWVQMNDMGAFACKLELRVYSHRCSYFYIPSWHKLNVLTRSSNMEKWKLGFKIKRGTCINDVHRFYIEPFRIKLIPIIRIYLY